MKRMNTMEHVKANGWSTVKDFLYWIFTRESFQQIVHVFFAIILPTAIISNQTDGKLNIGDIFDFYAQKPFWQLFCVYFIVIVIFSYCNKLKGQQEEHSQLAYDVTVELSSDISSLIECVKANDGDRFLDLLSPMVCNSIYTLLSKFHSDRDIRVSVIAQIQNHGYKYYMAGYKSKNNSSCDSSAYPLKNCTKYIRKILESDSEDYVILNKREIKDKFEFKKAKAEGKQLKEYIGIPYKGNHEKICFVIQIDFTKEKSCGRGKKKQCMFINDFIYPFVRLLAFGYTIDSLASAAKGDSVDGKQETASDSRHGS